MAYVQLDHFGKGGHWLNRLIIQPVAGMHFQTQIMGKAGHGPQAFKFGVAFFEFAFGMKIAIGAGMQLNDIGSDAMCGFDLLLIGGNE